MPARNPRRLKRQQPKLTPLALPMLVICIVLGIWLFFRASKLTKANRLALVVPTANGVEVTNFDFELGEVTTLELPAEAQVEVARGLGTWKLGSVWQLGVNEQLDGLLLAETMSRYYHLPVYVWADSPAAAYASGVGLPSAVFTKYKTNLTLADRIRLAVFSAGVKNTKRKTINLVERAYLVPKTLTDGQKGYVKTGEFSVGLTSIFTDADLASKNYKLRVVDMSGQGLGQEVGALAEVVGVKVGAIDRVDALDADCSVVSADSAAQELAAVFGCKFSQSKPEGSFEVEMVLGSQFAKRY